ncbi:hypothetical protein [Virgibacillus chiguensis]|uniref:FtsX-like permease family protein n=1 Tax=Virgibacillus chiguensis TaxID=411959 RepID=A0A1M5W9F6_9BACI|nr:hypothetical protein [Virgibacillus chiguensis]SHH84110.1 hypothetical protein SAMN05421807_11564 [Virgibacillus chiguensis]
MFHIHWQHIKSRPFAYFFTLLLITIILVCLPIAASSFTQANEQVKGDITDFSRGEYDLLVRPKNATSLIEKRLGLVEQNYLGVGTGGITLDTWKEIQTDERIEIAAPVAALGSFTKTETTFQIPKLDPPVRYTAQYYTNNGATSYKIGKDVGYVLHPLPNGQLVENNEVYSSNKRMVDTWLNNTPGFILPASYHPVVAIDPESEAALTGIDFSPFQTNSLKPYFDMPGAKEIPLIGVENTKTPIQASITVEPLNFTKTELQQLKDDVGLSEQENLGDIIFTDDLRLIQTVKQRLATIPALETNTHTVDFSSVLTSFEKDWYMLDDAYEIVMHKDYDLAKHGEALAISNINVHSSFFKVSPLDYKLDGEDIYVNLLNQEGDIPIHRDVEEVNFQTYNAEAKEEEFVYFVEVAKAPLQEYKNSLAASPLGIYQYNYGTLQATGEALHPTHLAGDFLPTPAHGLVPLEWAEFFKGNAPIDAIRIKVANITGYTEKAASKIKEIAEDIEAKGLHVDIIAGASHQTLVLDVEKIGKVEQPWTTLGAADKILNSWNLFSIATGITFLLVAVLALISRFQVMQTEQQPERHRLAWIGWLPTTINRFYRQQWFGQCILAIITSMIILFVTFGTPSIIWFGFGISIVIILVIKWFVGYIYTNRNERPIKIKPRKSLLLTNMYYYRHHILATVYQVLLTTCLLSFLLPLSYITIRNMTETTLGSYIHWQMNEEQWVLVIGISTLTLFTLIESLFHLWKARKNNLYLLYKIGWKNKHIRLQLRKETLIWSCISTGVGFIVSIFLILLTENMTWLLTGASIGIAIGIVIFILIINEYIASQFIGRIQKEG